MGHNIIPDDPGIAGDDDVTEPLVFGGRARHHVNSVVRTIKRNAGKMPKETMAQALSLSVDHLERMAIKHHIDLRCPPCDRARETEPRGA